MTRISEWPEIAHALDVYTEHCETGRIARSPWPHDHDRGERRLVGTLRKIVDLAMRAEEIPHQTLTTTALRVLIAGELEDMDEPADARRRTDRDHDRRPV